MKEQQHINFQRIARAIDFIYTNFRSQPTLDEVADEVHLSPYHFQRMFSEWAGTSPKKFLQYISVEHAKKLLKQHNATIFDTAHQTGLSGIGRLHDLFINIEGMTPGEYKYGGKNLNINYSFAQTSFGNVMVASTPKGICHLTFFKEKDKELAKLKGLFPQAIFCQQRDVLQQNALQILSHSKQELPEIKLHLKATEFQLKVWRALLEIPLGLVSTYGVVAHRIKNPQAVRAVGTAIAKNPVAYLIPCHRVIRSTGHSGEYHWGSTRKKLLIGWEMARAAS